jgi:hypothetical protein
VYFSKLKSDVVNESKKFKALVENKLGKRFKVIKSNFLRGFS